MSIVSSITSPITSSITSSIIKESDVLTPEQISILEKTIGSFEKFQDIYKETPDIAETLLSKFNKTLVENNIPVPDFTENTESFLTFITQGLQS